MRKSRFHLNVVDGQTDIHLCLQSSFATKKGKGVRPLSIFPYDFRGGDELVLHHVKTCNKNLDTWMANEVARYKESGTKLPITNFIKSAVKERLLMNSEFIQAGKAYLQSASSYYCVL